jgi:hypothetical protein
MKKPGKLGVITFFLIQKLCTQGNLLPLDLKDGFLTDKLITLLLMLILYFKFF